MKYMGSKARFAKAIYAKICELSPRNGRAWVEPFAGGMNMICEVPHEDGPRYANDCNKYLIELFKHLASNGELPGFIEKAEHAEIMQNKANFDDWYIGYIGFCCAYNGIFGTYAGRSNTKIGTVRDYQDESKRNVLKQALKLQEVWYCNASYNEIAIPENSIVYCDPPYENVTGYGAKFNHVEFWDWVREVSKEHDVFVSEYSAPEDFECVWQTETTSSIRAASGAGSKQSIEKLFRLRS